MRWTNALTGHLSVAAAVYLAACAPRATCLRMPVDFSVATPLTFSTNDNGVVSGNLYGSGSRGVVLIPGGRFDKMSLESEARALSSAGFVVLAIDLRGRGQSRGGHAGADGAYLDVMAAIDTLRHVGASAVALVGASLGGWAAAEASVRADPAHVDALVLLAHAAMDHPELLKVRTLFIVAAGDTSAAGVPRLVRIRDQYNRAAGAKKLVVLEGTAHGQLLFETDQRERVLREIIEFLSPR